MARSGFGYPGDPIRVLRYPGTLFGRQDAHDYGFLDTALHPDVHAYYHALSIDEKRRQFAPTLRDNAPADGQVIEQVWFAGVHTDVGGGMPKTQLSDITLAWMLHKARLHGIELITDEDAYPRLLLRSESANDLIDRSWNPLWGRPRVRPIAAAASIAKRSEFGWRPNDVTAHGN